MSMEYILITEKEVADLQAGKEIYCSLDGKDFAIMLEDAFKNTYLGTK